MKLLRPSLLALGAILASPGLLWAGPVNINSADATTLAAELTGVGAVLAAEIVRDREMNGRYESPEALTRVKGIGPRVIETNRDNIRIVSESARN